MTIEEFSNQFDVLLNSYSTIGTTLSLNEYEKSVYLTKAQRELVTRYYNGLNAKGESFENTEENRRNLQHLVKVETYKKSDGEIENDSPKLDFNKIAFIVLESAVISNENESCYKQGKEVDVIPVTHDDYLRIRRNPFKGASKNRVLRLNEDNKVVLKALDGYNITSYTATYVKKPNPIILIDLPDDLSIDGSKTKTADETLKESEIIHKDILDLAVRLAISDRATKSTKEDN